MFEVPGVAPKAPHSEYLYTYRDVAESRIRELYRQTSNGLYSIETVEEPEPKSENKQ